MSAGVIWHPGPMAGAAAGATVLLRGWKVAPKIALFALSNVAERGIGSRGHTLEGIDNGDPL